MTRSCPVVSFSVNDSNRWIFSMKESPSRPPLQLMNWSVPTDSYWKGTSWAKRASIRRRNNQSSLPGAGAGRCHPGSRPASAPRSPGCSVPRRPRCPLERQRRYTPRRARGFRHGHARRRALRPRRLCCGRSRRIGVPPPARARIFGFRPGHRCSNESAKPR